MHDVGYIVAGYGATVVVIGGYRWRLARRASKARTLLAALSGRPPGVRAPRGAHR
jgi:hypothetical protein